MKAKNKKSRKLPGMGYNPAAITGNASGFHAKAKGKGSEYNRAREKAAAHKEGL